MTNINRVLACLLFSVIISASHWSLRDGSGFGNLKLPTNQTHITIALLSAPRYESRGEKELTRTILSIVDEFENFTKIDSSISAEIFFLNHFGTSHVNLFETFDDLRKFKRYSFYNYMNQNGMILNDTEEIEEVFEFRGSETYYDQFKTRVSLPIINFDHEPFISPEIPLYFSYKEHYFPLKDAPIIFKQLQHVSSLLRETYYHMRKSFSDKELDEHVVLLLEDDFPFCSGYFEKMVRAMRISKKKNSSEFCGLFMATGGSSILMKASLLPYLSEILRSEPSFKNGRLLKMPDGSISPIPQDVTIQSCLLGNWKDCLDHPILSKCKSTVSDILYFRHIGEKSTDKFLKHAGNKWQCNWRNPLTSYPTMPYVIFER